MVKLFEHNMRKPGARKNTRMRRCQRWFSGELVRGFYFGDFTGRDSVRHEIGTDGSTDIRRTDYKEPVSNFTVGQVQSATFGTNGFGTGEADHLELESPKKAPADVGPR